MRDLASCVVEKFNNFNVTRIEFNKSIRQTFCLIDIIYKPVRKPDEIMNSYFSEKLNLAFCASFSEGTKAKHGNITIVQIVALEMINLTVISKIVQVGQVMFTIFNI